MTNPIAPFLRPMPYGTFDFAALTPSMVPAALAEGRRLNLEEVDAILSNPAPPTFDNLIVPLQKAGEALSRVQTVFGVYTNSLITEEVEAIAEEEAPRDAEHADTITLDPRFWARVDELYRTRAGVPEDPVANRLLDDLHRDLKNSGALLDEKGKDRIKAINKEEAALVVQFEQRLLKGREGALVTGADTSELAGMPADQKEAAVGHEKAPIGGWAIDIVNTTQQPAAAFLQSGALRRRLFDASRARNLTGDTETLSLIVRLERLRSEAAQLLGYPSYAAYHLSDQMAKDPETALALTSRFGRAAMAKAVAESAQFGNVPVWDRAFAEERVRKSDYAIDDDEVKPYFEFESVLTHGVFFMAKKLYGLDFERRTDIPGWHPDVRVYEVRNEDGSAQALYYLDPFARDGKSGGAWMDSLVDQSRLTGEKAVVTNSLNVVKPPPGRPALLTLDETKTFFHEFGHGLHGMLSDVMYPDQSGTNVATDFVELPSQIHEHWVLHKDVVGNYARHVDTGAPIPDELLERLRAAETFGSGYRVGELAAAATLDLAWHMRPAGAPELKPEEVPAFERQALTEAGFDPDAVPPRYSTPYFAHIWSSGYAASYNAYIFSNVLDCDGFSWFEENGGLTRANGEHFRQTVLSRGGSAPPEDLFRSFRGRDPEIAPALKDNGLVEEEAPRPARARP